MITHNESQEVQNVPPDKRIWGPWATAGLGVVILIISLVVQVFAAIVFTSAGILTGGLEDISYILDSLGLLIAVLTIISNLICVGLILVIIKALDKASIAEYLGLRRVSGKTIMLSIAITLGVVGLAKVLDYIPGYSPDTGFMDTIYHTSVYPVVLWIALVIFAPVFEEIFFRGFLFAGFRQSRIGIIGTILLTALLWSSLHIQYDFYGIAYIFITGIVIGLVRYKTDSLWGPLLIHSLMNLLAIVEMELIMNGLLG